MAGIRRVPFVKGRIWTPTGGYAGYRQARRDRAIRIAGLGKLEYLDEPQDGDDFQGGALDSRWTASGLAIDPAGSDAGIVTVTLVAVGAGVVGYIDFNNRHITSAQRNPVIEARLKLYQVAQNLCQFGWKNNDTGALPGDDFAHFQVNAGGSAANWFGRCDASGSTTQVDTGTLQATTWNTYRIEIDSNRIASFYIDDVFKGSMGTNLPAAATLLQPYLQLNSNDAGTFQFEIDFVKWWMERPTS